MNIEMLSIPDLNRRAFEALCREIGPGDALRFLGQFGLVSGDYTLERRDLFRGLDIDEYPRAVREMNFRPRKERSPLEKKPAASDPTAD